MNVPAVLLTSWLLTCKWGHRPGRRSRNGVLNMRRTLVIWLTLFGVLATTRLVAGEPLQLGMPVACDLGRTCFIQSYVDIDPGPAVQDFACGGATYANHDGTDVRLLSARDAAAGVAVLAAAAGTVKSVRDGMPDRFANAESRALVANRECGNGVVIDHGGGWETQYCHMQSGSVKAAAGDKVDKGTVLGSVGYSGLAEFAHLHLSVRHNGKAVDPFTGTERSASCQRDPEATSGLWDETVRKAHRYANGEIIAAGFTSMIPDLKQSEIDGGIAMPAVNSPQLLFFARLINLRADDVVTLDVQGPGGFAAQSTSKPLDRNKATWIAYAGKRLKESAWATGTYAGIVRVMRGGAVVIEKSHTWELAP